MTYREINVLGRSSYNLNLRRTAILTLRAVSPDGVVEERTITVQVIVDCEPVVLGRPTDLSSNRYSLWREWNFRDDDEAPALPGNRMGDNDIDFLLWLRLRGTSTNISPSFRYSDDRGVDESPRDPEPGAAWAGRAHAVTLINTDLDERVQLPGPEHPIWTVYGGSDRIGTVSAAVSEPLIGAPLTRWAGRVQAQHQIVATFCWYDELWIKPVAPTINIVDTPAGQVRYRIGYPSQDSLLKYPTNVSFREIRTVNGAQGVAVPITVQVRNPAGATSASTMAVTGLGAPAFVSVHSVDIGAVSITVTVSSGSGNPAGTTTRLQISRSSTFSSPTTVVGGRTVSTKGGTTYYVRARHEHSNGAVSAWTEMAGTITTLPAFSLRIGWTAYTEQWQDENFDWIYVLNIIFYPEHGTIASVSATGSNLRSGLGRIVEGDQDLCGNDLWFEEYGERGASAPYHAWFSPRGDLGHSADPFAGTTITFTAADGQTVVTSLGSHQTTPVACE